MTAQTMHQRSDSRSFFSFFSCDRQAVGADATPDHRPVLTPWEKKSANEMRETREEEGEKIISRGIDCYIAVRSNLQLQKTDFQS